MGISGLTSLLLIPALQTSVPLPNWPAAWDWALILKLAVLAGLVGIAILTWRAPRWLEIGILLTLAAVTIGAPIFALIWPSGPGPTGTAPVQLRLKASELASGAVMRPNREVTLVVERQDKPGGPEEYTDLVVAGLFAADGRSVGYSSEQPDSILLAVPADKLDGLREALAAKKVAYLKPEAAGLNPTSTVTVSPTPGPTLPPAGVKLRRDAIKSTIPQRGDVVVVLIAARRNADGAVIERTEKHYNARLTSEDDDGVTISLERGSREGPALDFGKQLADADTILLLPSAPPTATPVATAPPSTGG